MKLSSIDFRLFETYREAIDFITRTPFIAWCHPLGNEEGYLVELLKES